MRMKKITIAAFLALAAVFGIAPLLSAEENSAQVCAQVITNAVSSSGECKAFPTPCDVPEDWTVVSDCSAGANTPVIDIKNHLRQLRADLKAFSDNKKQEESEKAAAAKEKVAAKRKIIEARREESRIKKEEKRRTVLIKLIDIQIKQLENTKERVAKMPNISVELKTQLNASIEAAAAVLTKKADVADAATPEQMKELAKEIKELFKSKRDIVKQIVDAILASKADKAIVAAEGRLVEIKAKIAEMKTAGQDVADLESLLAIAQEKISAAKTKAGKEELKGAINDLKEAYKNMKSAVEKTVSAE